MLYALSFWGGFAACWFCKDKIRSVFISVETQIRSLEDKIKALKAKI